MIQDPSYQHLLELSWRRKLTAAKKEELRAWLMAHPEAEAEWESEAALNEALDQFPNASVPSNFTARVLEAVRLEEAAVARGRAGQRAGWLWLRGWLPKTAIAMVVLAVTLLSYRQHQVVSLHDDTRRQEIARSVLAIAAVPTLPNPDVLENFKAVQSLSQTPPDQDLLAIFQ